MLDPIFPSAERQLLADLALRLTGSAPDTRPKLEACMLNVYRRMQATGSASLVRYLALIERQPSELAAFISALTLHTTSWFRESPHFDRLARFAASRIELKEANAAARDSTRLAVLSAGCSSGEEA